LVIPMLAAIKRKSVSGSTKKFLPKDKAFTFSPITKIQANSWDIFFGEIRAIFLKVILGVRRSQIERSRKMIMQELVDYYVAVNGMEKSGKKFTPKDFVITGIERISCIDLARGFNIQDSTMLSKIRIFENIITWLDHLLARREFTQATARTVKELISSITWYAAVGEKLIPKELLDKIEERKEMSRLAIHGQKFIGRQLSNDRKEKYIAIANAFRSNQHLPKPKKESTVINHLVISNKVLFSQDDDPLKIRRSFDLYISRHPEFLSSIR
jgi:hypothetical protein